MSNDTAKIDRAIRSCIRECFRSTAILPTFVEFLEELQQDPEWKASEVRLVEEGVRRILKGTPSKGKHAVPLDVRARKSA
jgi:hypothetical protein